MATAEDIQHHYDISNEFYNLFLDQKYKIYSCGVWDDANNLEAAQINKLKRIADFANINKDCVVLDVGCGWGGMMQYLVEKRNVRNVIGLTLSIEQKSYVDNLNFQKINTELCRWEDFKSEQQFDAIVSIGAFEHFASLEDRAKGKQIEIYRNFFQHCYQWSKPNCFLALQSIVTANHPKTLDKVRDIRFLLKEIFPGSALPTIDDIQMSICGLYEIQELRTIGCDYIKTLEAWKNNIEINADEVIRNFGKELYERYRKYFTIAKNNFQDGCTNLIQISLKKKSTPIAV